MPAYSALRRVASGAYSDIDIMIDLDPAVDAKLSVYDYVDIKLFIEDLFDQPVDVVNRLNLKSHVRPSALADLIAF